MSFILTGCGRSGTKFLAQLLNSSPTWEVLHEVEPPYLVVNHCGVQERFQRDNYGEVNSLLREVVCELDVQYKAVLLRHPKTMLLSAYNQQGAVYTPYLMNMLALSLRALDRAIIPRVNLSPVNVSKKVVRKFGSLPHRMQEHYDRECVWFERKYYAGR